jgi:serine/threonine-protein kinase ATR
MAVFVQQALSMARELIVLANVVVVKEISGLSMEERFPKLKALAPSPLIVPLEDQLTVTLPHDCSSKSDHRPFPTNLVRFASTSVLTALSLSLIRRRTCC